MGENECNPLLREKNWCTLTEHTRITQQSWGFTKQVVCFVIPYHSTHARTHAHTHTTYKAVCIDRLRGSQHYVQEVTRLSSITPCTHRTPLVGESFIATVERTGHVTAPALTNCPNLYSNPVCARNSWQQRLVWTGTTEECLSRQGERLYNCHMRACLHDRQGLVVELSNYSQPMWHICVGTNAHYFLWNMMSYPVMSNVLDQENVLLARHSTVQHNASLYTYSVVPQSPSDSERQNQWTRRVDLMRGLN